MDNTNANITGAFGGALITGLAWWDRLDRDTQRQIQRARDAAASANDKISAWLASSDYVRMLISTVRDLQIGIAYSTAPNIPPQTIPNLNASLNRPQISSENGARSYQWPPKGGTYDEVGRNTSVGELTMLGLALTYEEPRAFLLGLTQNGTLTDDCKGQIYRASNGLSTVVCEQNLTPDQYKDAWRFLFAHAGGTPSPTPGSSSARHEDPSYEPTATSTFAGLSIIPLTSNPGGVPGYPYANRNTDSVQRYRVTAPAAGVGAGQPIATIAFSNEYRDLNNAPFQPAVPLAMSSGNAAFGAINISSTGFTLVCKDLLVGSSVHDVMLTVVAGQPTR